MSKGLLPLSWHPRNKERLLIIAELLALLGTDNPDSYLHNEVDPRESNSRLSATLSQLPLDFAQNLLDYCKETSQRNRDLIQAVLRYAREAGKNPRSLLNDSEVRRVEFYLSGIPVFSALTSGDPCEVGSMVVNHAERTSWEAHKKPRAFNYPYGYFFYTVVWPKTALPQYDDLVWLNGNALALAPYSSTLTQRGAFDREFCEVLLESSVPAISSGAL